MNHIFKTADGKVSTTAVETAYGNQSIVDGVNSNYWRQYGYEIVADHVNQDFRHLSEVEVGDRATFDDAPLICVAKSYGHRVNGKLTLDGRRFFCRHDLLTYTCSANNDDGVWLVEWRYDRKMTANDYRNKLLDRARGFLRFNEADGTHKTIVDIYNTLSPLPRGYKVTYSDPWCATYVSAMAINAGLTEIIPCECSCEQMIKGFQALGRWVENDGYYPAPGDIIFYDWDDSGAGDCIGTADHVGIVCEVDGDNLTIIEGNISDSVGYRAFKVNNRYIRGYGVPDYESIADPLDIGNPADWAYKSCLKAVKAGVVHGDGLGVWDWDKPITKEQICVLFDNLGFFEGYSIIK